MALVVKDRVKESSTTSGTGTLTLAGAVPGFQAFSAALSNGDTTYYAIAESSTGAFEVGLGTYTTSGTTLARTTVLSSSDGGTAISLSGAGADVFITQPADKAAYFDASGDLFLNQDPTSALQSATKQYVDTIAAAGIHYHAPVRVEHPSNLTATYDNGTSGVGATLTNSGTQAALVLDNVTMVAADRVLIANQTNQAHNGVYTVTNIGSASTNWVLTRATDADSYGPSDPDALGEGDAFFIKEGDTNAGHLDVMTTSGTITFGTTNIVFSEVAETSIYSAGDGLTLTGTVFAAGAGTGVTVNANDIAIGQDVGTSADVTFNTVTADLTGAVTGNVTGNASTASALQTARNIALTGAVTGSTSFDGSGNVSIATTATSDPTITLAGDLSGSATLTNLGNATLTATITANSVALGTDTTGNYVAGITAGAAITVTGSGSESASPTVNHADTSSQSSVDNSGATVIQDVTLDTYGHVTGLGSHTLTLANLGYTGATNANYITNNNQLTNGAGYTTYTANQSLNTSNSPSFAGVNINGNLNAVDDIYLADQILHEGDTDTYMQFNAANTWRVVTGGSQRLVVNSSGVEISNGGLGMNGNNITEVEDIYLRDKLYHNGDTDTYFAFDTNEINIYSGGKHHARFNSSDFISYSALKEDYDALSGTTPTIDVDAGGGFSLTTSGNTTFTFSSCTSGVAVGFVLQVTAGGTHTLTWPSSVDWAGGTAPDAPASGESNLYVFYTRDGGTNWIGVLSAAAYA